MTNTKKIRLLNDYVNKGLGQQKLLIIQDRWKFDPDVYPRTYEIREEYTVQDAINQFNDKKGYIYEGMEFKQIQKSIEKNMPISIIAEYQDTKDEFFKEHPNFQKEEQEKLKQLLGQYNKYKNQFM